MRKAIVVLTMCWSAVGFTQVEPVQQVELERVPPTPAQRRLAVSLRVGLPTLATVNVPLLGVGGLGGISGFGPAVMGGLGLDYLVSERLALGVAFDATAFAVSSVAQLTLTVDPSVSWYFQSGGLQGLFVRVHAPLSHAEAPGYASNTAGIGADLGYSATWSNGLFVALSAGPTATVTFMQFASADASGIVTQSSSAGGVIAFRTGLTVGVLF